MEDECSTSSIERRKPPPLPSPGVPGEGVNYRLDHGLKASAAFEEFIRAMEFSRGLVDCGYKSCRAVVFRQVPHLASTRRPGGV